MKSIQTIFLSILFFTAILLAACETGDSVELGCVTDEDCNTPGAPEKWCQTETGICLSFTSPPGDTGDATPDE